MRTASGWHEEAIELYLNSDLSYREIGERFGRDRTTVIKVLRQAGAKRDRATARRGGRTRIDSKEAVSTQHHAVGVKLNIWRTIRQGLTATQAAEMLSTHSYMISKMESGQHEFTLTQLQRIANLLNMTVPDLITPSSASAPSLVRI